MEKQILGQILTIKSKTADVETLFKSWGYQVEASETLTLLWPPAIQLDEVSVINSDNVFLFSSFTLEPHGNINVRPVDIRTIVIGLSKVSVHSRVKVLRKNAELIIDSNTAYPAGYNPMPFTESKTNYYTVSDDGVYYLFNRSGATPIGKGQTVILTLGSFIKRYTSGYLDKIIYPLVREELSGESLLNDLLVHYTRVENFTIEPFTEINLSDTASRYIEKCNEIGVINSAAKRFIEEGWL